MSLLDGNWKVHKDPSYDAKLTRHCFGDAQLQRSVEPAGWDWRFRARTIEKLLWLVTQTSVDSLNQRKLLGRALSGETVATFWESGNFNVHNGLGQIQTGAFEVEGLKSNEAHEAFLLDLWWTSHTGWGSEMHALALASSQDKDLEWDYDDSNESNRGHGQDSRR